MELNTLDNPIAVLISDVHFSLQTLSIAGKALRLAVEHATKLQVPLIIAGDLHHTKAILRGECVSAIIDCVKNATVPIKVLIGNHDKIHEKSNEHALEFLRPYVDLIDKPVQIDKDCGVGFIPYQSTNEDFLALRSMFTEGQIIVCHQGFKGAFMGEYVKDDSSVNVEDVKNFRIISGHYHRHQSLGTITYVGSPYTTSFSESSDGSKGHAILYANGKLAQVPTNLRKHIVLTSTYDELFCSSKLAINKDDLIWLKVSGPSIELDKLNKKEVGKKLFGHQNFKFDKIPTDAPHTSIDMESFTNEEALDNLIDLDNQTEYNKDSLKKLWRNLLQG
jgi:DNA repair exonuclease SbcCD nuclease subunit